MSKATEFAALALADLRPALARAKAAPVDGPRFDGSHNCLANIERHHTRHRPVNWFAADAMRFFGTRINSGFLDLPTSRVSLFVTTEKPPHGARAASLRAYLWDSAEIETLGPFCTESLRVIDQARDIVADALSPAFA